MLRISIREHPGVRVGPTSMTGALITGSQKVTEGPERPGKTDDVWTETRVMLPQAKDPQEPHPLEETRKMIPESLCR